MRQRRDKAEAQKADDDHRGIPRDADGNLIFLILSSDMRSSYERKVAACEAAWRAGEPLAVAEATTLVHFYRQPPPAWLEQAVVELATQRRTKAQAKRYLEAQKRFARYSLVRDLKVGIPGIYGPTAGDLSWPEVYAAASRQLEEEEHYAKAAEDTVKADYAAVKRDLKAGDGGKYFVLKDQRYRNNRQPNFPSKVKTPG